MRLSNSKVELIYLPTQVWLKQKLLTSTLHHSTKSIVRIKARKIEWSIWSDKMMKFKITKAEHHSKEWHALWCDHRCESLTWSRRRCLYHLPPFPLQADLLYPFAEESSTNLARNRQKSHRWYSPLIESSLSHFESYIKAIIFPLSKCQSLLSW